MASHSVGLESVALDVRSLLIPFAHGLSLRDFQHEAKSLLGPNGLPFRKFGYSCLLDMLRDMPDVLTVMELGQGEVLLKGVLDAKTKHIGDMVKKQKNNNASKQSQNARYLAQKKTQERSQLVTKNIARTRAIPRDIQNNLFAILYRMSPISTDNLVPVYQRRYGKPLEWERYGFTDVPDMMRSLSQVAMAKRGSVCLFSLRDRAKYADQMEDKNQNYQPKALNEGGRLPIVPVRESLMIAPLLARNLAKLLADFPHALKVDDLKLEYRKKFGTDFDFRESDPSITSMLKFCIALPDMFKVTQIDGVNYCGPLNAIFPQPQTMPSEVLPKRESKNSTPQKKRNATSQFDRIKGDVVLDDAVQLRTQELPPNRKLGDAFEILIGEVYTPQKFYFQLQATAPDLEELMDDLNTFYEGPKSVDYKLRSVDFLAGQLVAIRYVEDGRWHRGIIQQLRNSCTAQVRFVDFGTVQKEQIDNLRYLRKAYVLFPAQAILGRVAGIRPLKNDSKWSVASSSRFYSLLTDLSVESDEPLLGVFRGVQMVGDVVVSLELVDPARNPPVGLNIGKTMVQEGLALVDPNALTTDRRQICPFDIRLDQTDIKLDSITITKVDLNNQNAIHIIELNELCLATSAGISSLFQWKGRDLLAHFMELKQLGYKRYSVPKSECEKLFSLGLIENVPGFIDEKRDRLVDEINLYLLKDVPFLVKAFDSSPDPELLKSLNREIANRQTC
eukprot:TCALIF_04900-PA protein Name:"Similar to TDRD5 Tudor domain-containing protein 5 (Canis familiaris)" AED:0.05 eAED:0.05 QI:76/0.88/0.9/1/0.88/0.9/10/1264/728